MASETPDNEVTDRPKPPFRDRDGSPRVVTRLSSSGVVEYRPGQLVIDVRRVPGASENPELIRELIERVLGVSCAYDDQDLERMSRTGFLRVRCDRRFDSLDAATRINQDLNDDVASVNTVFKIGAVSAAPMHLSPMHLSPMHLSPMHLSTEYGGDLARFFNSSTARPALVDELGRPRGRKEPLGKGSASVAVIDTGFPIDGLSQASDLDYTEHGSDVRERPDVNADRYLDIAAGHSTFIRTIIERASPTARIFVQGVMENDGDGDEIEIADALGVIDARTEDKSQLLVNLSFGGFYPRDVAPPAVAQAIRRLVEQGAVVVAAAGNEGVCRRKFPAAMPEVLAVGALGACGPAPFSNHGGWVDACAPGEDLVSQFFVYDGAFEPLATSTAADIDEFDGWAVWSGTSFATPAVVGALAELIEIHDCTAREAVDRLVRARGLFRIPDYGVVVNRIF